jgi:serine phosphatase RsbU (regulator of sigma subunit)
MPFQSSPTDVPGSGAGSGPDLWESDFLQPPSRVPGSRPGSRWEGWPGWLVVSAWPAPVATAICALVLAVIVWIDLHTGTELEMAPYYFLPIILASLRFQVRGALVVAIGCAILSTWPSPVEQARRANPAVYLSNALTHLLVFVFVALVTGTLQAERERLREQREALRKAHGALQEDLHAAASLQRHLLRRPLPSTPGLDLAAEICFARGVGGDFYDLRRDGRHLELCIADVSGKGARAALISAALRALLDEMAGQQLDPTTFLSHLNDRLADDLPDGMFVTMFYGRLNLETGELWYASAGHDPPFLCREEAVEPLDPTAPALGVVTEMTGHTARAILHPGESLLLYTDGLTTARHPSGGRVGEERVVARLQECTRSSSARSPARLAAEMLCLASADKADELEDDVAVIAMRRQ